MASGTAITIAGGLIGKALDGQVAPFFQMRSCGRHVRANALLIVPAELPTVPVGTELQAIMLDDPQHVAEPPY